MVSYFQHNALHIGLKLPLYWRLLCSKSGTSPQIGIEYFNLHGSPCFAFMKTI